MRFYTTQPQAYCGLDRHARTMSLCIVHQDGASLLHRNRQTRPAMFLKALAPYREDLVVAGACIFPWDGLAALGAQAPRPLGRGPARSLQALHGGTATHDTSDAQQSAVLLRGGMLPPASGSPAAMRATRERRRRRLPLTRTRAALLAHMPHTNRPYHRPAIGKKLASKANRAGGAERLPAPAVPKRVALALALLACDDQWLRDVAWTIVQPARQHDAQTLDRLQAVLGIGNIVRVVRLDARQAMTRFPRGQDLGADCRLGTGAKASAGQRAGTSGAQMGPRDRKWAFSAAAVLLLRHHPAGQQDLARLEHNQGQGKALPICAHPRARAVYDL